jgi:LmbE family N-acetylglucosaminyl deacetylase
MMADFAGLLGRTLVIVAHPDDETVGCGALLQRIAEPIVVFATDGAPRDQYFWGKYGSRLRYQRVREEEARVALALAGVSEVAFLGAQPLANGEGIADQELYLHLEEAYSRIANIVNHHRPETILTLAYEGGHPDHDCCSILAAHLASQHELPVWEVPLYHLPSSGEIEYQRYFTLDKSEIVLDVTCEELAVKREMVQAYASQHPFLLAFDLKTERVRLQPAYDYTRPSHPGKLNYEAWGWPISGADICAAYERLAPQEQR